MALRMLMLSSLCRSCVRWRRCIARDLSLLVPSTQSPMAPQALTRLSLPAVCSLSSDAVLHQTEGEKRIADILTEKLSPSYLQVRDISGGCGSMYEIAIDSEQFKGKRILLQHRMVNEALGEEVVKSLHGLTIRIGNPEES